MDVQDYPVIAEADVVVVGGGLAGVAATLACAAAGRQTLLLESRPLLGWEAASAFALDWPGAEQDTSPLLAVLRAAGGVRGARIDAPLCEMALERLVTQADADLLFYSTPVAVWRDGERIGGLIIGNKSGHQIVRARAFIDATEEGLLWRMAGSTPEGSDPVRGRFSVFYNHLPESVLTAALPNVPGAANLRLRPSVWPGETAVEFEAEAPAENPNALLLALRRAIPAVAETLRGSLPQFSDALLTHTSREPLPLTGPTFGTETVHPQLANLFGAGVWLAAPGEREAAGVLPKRWQRGEEVGKLVGRLAAEMTLPGLPPTGPSPEPREAPASDVVVVGGGTGGALAGIAAGRQGAKVTLLEGSHFLGGIGAGGGIHWYYHGFTGGIQDEVDERTRVLSETFGAANRLFGFHPDAKQIVLQEMAEAAGVTLVFRSTLIGAQCEGPSLRMAEAAEPLGAVRYAAPVFVDATGDVDLAARAGASFNLGRERDQLPHSFSQACQVLDNNGGITFRNFDAGYVDATDVTDLTRARRLGLSHLWREEGFTAETRLLTVAPLLGLRQSRHIVGDYTLTLDDQVARRRFPDVVSYARAHYDNHSADYENESDEAALWVWLLGAWQDQIASEVPYRCLLPQGVEGLLIACRGIALTSDAHMMFRMQRDMQRLGEAAGTAAALAAQAGVTPRALEVRRIQDALLATGALSRESVIDEKGGSPEEWVAQLSEAQPKEAVWQLAHAGEAVIPLLLDALKSDSERQRFWSAVTLAMYRRPEAAPELLRCLCARADVKPEGNRTVPFWQGVIVLLGRIGDLAAAPEIARQLQEPGMTMDALITAVRALGRIGDPAAVDAIREMLARTDVEALRVFQISMGGTNQITDDAHWQLDLSAAEALAQLGAPDPALAEKYRDDPRAYVRRYAERIRRMSLLPIRM